MECLECRRLLSATTLTNLSTTALVQPSVSLVTQWESHVNGDSVSELTIGAIIGQEYALKTTAKPKPAPLPASLTGAPDAAGNVTIVGKTFPKAIVKVSLGTSGAIAATVKADKKGHFQVTVQVGFGTTDVQVLAQSGKKTAAATLTVNRPAPTPTPTSTQTPDPDSNSDTHAHSDTDTHPDSDTDTIRCDLHYPRSGLLSTASPNRHDRRPYEPGRHRQPR